MGLETIGPCSQPGNLNSYHPTCGIGNDVGVSTFLLLKTSERSGVGRSRLSRVFAKAKQSVKVHRVKGERIPMTLGKDVNLD